MAYKNKGIFAVSLIAMIFTLYPLYQGNCHDTVTLKQLWVADISSEAPVISDLRIFNDQLYGIFNGNKLFSINSKGKVLWILGLSDENMGRNIQEANDAIWSVIGPRTIVSVNKNNGHVLRSFEVNVENIQGNIGICQGRFYFVDQDGYLHCEDLHSEKEVWVNRTEKIVQFDKFHFTSEHVFVTTLLNELICYQRITGEFVWKIHGVKNLIIKENKIFFSYEEKKRTVSSFLSNEKNIPFTNLLTKKEMIMELAGYKENVGVASHHLICLTQSSKRIDFTEYVDDIDEDTCPVFDNNFLYYRRYNGEIVAYDLSAKQTKWVWPVKDDTIHNDIEAAGCKLLIQKSNLIVLFNNAAKVVQMSAGKGQIENSYIAGYMRPYDLAVGDGFFVVADLNGSIWCYKMNWDDRRNP